MAAPDRSSLLPPPGHPVHYGGYNTYGPPQQQPLFPGPHSAPPQSKTAFMYPTVINGGVQQPSTSANDDLPPSYYTMRYPLQRSHSSQQTTTRMQMMGPPSVLGQRKQSVFVFSSEMGNRAGADVRAGRTSGIIDWHRALSAIQGDGFGQLRQQTQTTTAPHSMKRDRPGSPVPAAAASSVQRPPSRKTPQPRTPKTPSSVKQPTTPLAADQSVAGASSSLPSTPAGTSSVSVGELLSTSADPLPLSEEDNHPLRKMERMTQEPSLFEPPSKLPRLSNVSSPKEQNAMLSAISTSKQATTGGMRATATLSHASTATAQNGHASMLLPPAPNDDSGMTAEELRSRQEKIEKIKCYEKFIPADAMPPVLPPMAHGNPMMSPMMSVGMPGQQPMYQICGPQQQMYSRPPGMMLMPTMKGQNVHLGRASPDLDPVQAKEDWDRMVNDMEMSKMAARQEPGGGPPRPAPNPDMTRKPVGMVPPNARLQQQQQQFMQQQMYDEQYMRGAQMSSRMMGPSHYQPPMDPRLIGQQQQQQQPLYYPPQGPMFADAIDQYGMPMHKQMMGGPPANMLGVYQPVGPPQHAHHMQQQQQQRPSMANQQQPPHQHQSQPTHNNTYVNATLSIQQLNIQNVVPSAGHQSHMPTMNMQQMNVHQQHPPNMQRTNAPIPMGGPSMNAQQQQPQQPPLYECGPQDFWNHQLPEPLTNLDAKVPSQKLQYFPQSRQEQPAQPPPSADFGGGFQGSMMAAQQTMKTDGQKVCMQQQAQFASVSAAASGGQPMQMQQQHYDFQQQQLYGQPGGRR